MKIALLSATLVLSIAPVLPGQTAAAGQQSAPSESRKVDQVDQAARERAKTASRDHANMDGAVAKGPQANTTAATEEAAAGQSANAAAGLGAAAPADDAADNNSRTAREAKTNNYGLWGLVGLLGLFGLGRRRRAVSRRSDYEGQNFRRIA